MLTRRDFFRATTYTVGSFAIPAVPPLLMGQSFVRQALPMSFSQGAPSLFGAILNLGGKVLGSVAYNELQKWLREHFVIEKPPATPANFTAQFAPTHQIVSREGNAPHPFVKQITTTNTYIHIDRFVHVVENSPKEFTALNVGELNEYSNTENSLLYARCGCYTISLPVCQSERARPSASECDKFKEWVENDGASDPHLKGFPQNTTLNLDYVRRLKRTDLNKSMIGFGYHPSPQNNTEPRRLIADTSIKPPSYFAVVDWG